MQGLRGVPKPFHVRYRDRHGINKYTRTWYAVFWQRGKRTKMALGLDKTKAVNKIKELLAETAQGRDLSQRPRLEDLLQWVSDDYKLNGIKSARQLPMRFRRLKDFFGNPELAHITPDRIRTYCVHRQEKDGAANGSINLELAALARGFSLGRLTGRVYHAPKILWLKVRNARKGFFELADFKAIAAKVGDRLHAFVWTCRLTGWRPRAEVLSREWQHVDFEGGWLRLEPHETKNGRGRNFPLTPELRAVLEAQKARREALELGTGRIIRWVFFGPQGRQIKDYARGWRKAAAEAGLQGRILYDCRRTMARDLEDAQVRRSTAMEIMGHETEAMYRRYAIRTAEDLKRAGEQIHDLYGLQAQRSTKIVSLPSK